MILAMIPCTCLHQSQQKPDTHAVREVSSTVMMAHPHGDVHHDHIEALKWDMIL